MEALLLETFRLVGGGFKGTFFNPPSREWWGWFIPFTLAGLWHYRARHKKLALEEGLNYVFPASTYLSSSFLHDILCIGLKFFIFRVIFRTLMNTEIEDFVFMNFTTRTLFDLFHPAPVAALKSGLFVNVLYSFGLFMAFEFAWWVAHWATHKIPVLWAFHKVHHSVVLMNPLASKRVHFLDDAILMVGVGVTSGLVLFAFRLFGYTPSIVLVYAEIPLFQLMFLFFGAVRHSHIPMSWGKLEAVFSSPFMHQVHHSYKPEHINKNFGQHTILFDWLFDTLYRPHEGEEVRFGLSEESAKAPPLGFLRLYFYQPIADSLEYLRSGQYFAFRRRS